MNVAKKLVASTDRVGYDMATEGDGGASVPAATPFATIESG
jgi:hypothetical protein